jgi:hypothetical protein
MAPGVDSAFKANDYQEYSWEFKLDRPVNFTTSPPSLSRLSRLCETLEVSQPYRSPRPVTCFTHSVSIHVLDSPVYLHEYLTGFSIPVTDVILYGPVTVATVFMNVLSCKTGSLES